MQTIAPIAGLLALLASGLMAGLFYAYSVSVIWGLDRADPRAAIDSFNGINVAILNPLFLLVFMGVPLLGGLAAILFWQSGQSAAMWMFAASAIVYAVGTLGVTMGINVPQNVALANGGVPQDIAAARHIWDAFTAGWLPWNHVRAIAATLSLLLAALGLYLA
jgi:uncharacterized membrane protein